MAYIKSRVPAMRREDAMARGYSQLTLKQLFQASGHHCAFPGCVAPTIQLTAHEPVILGEIAHIEGSSNHGPRPNPSLSPTARDLYPNLILLCAHHHTLVDKMDSCYSVEELKEWKRAAEKATADKLSAGAIQVSFAELEVVCNAYADGDLDVPQTPMIAVQPQAKMDANALTSAIGPTMNVGLALAPQVADYIRCQARLSSGFPGRLRSGFVRQYDRLLDEGIVGDALFISLIDFGANSAAAPQTDSNGYFVIRAATAGVLCHLFEVCDVFKAPA